ncbi:unnamed protein product [Rangifer tarandus platyrhynchus]|uniref:Uncharacterized protein n=1 Tax=Rangifer tarandus platyrhynchus TaxID=3082113 RepID=A0ABN8ZBU0_RANTA|nr:unnamed protein product [Rangifer tarandus platyrhynchus]CAI9689259.1 unnamed protein product [Rangifer tarandus platyrhynchus]
MTVLERAPGDVSADVPTDVTRRAQRRLLPDPRRGRGHQETAGDWCWGLTARTRGAGPAERPSGSEQPRAPPSPAPFPSGPAPFPSGPRAPETPSLRAAVAPPSSRTGRALPPRHPPPPAPPLRPRPLPKRVARSRRAELCRGCARRCRQSRR